MNSKKTIASILALFLLSATLPIIAMLSKEQSTQEKRNYTQPALENEKKPTDLLLKEIQNKTPNLQKVISFIEKGADVNARINLEITPLLYACATNNVKLAEVLIEHGAQINMSDNEGNTPLHIACQYGYIELVILLLKNNAPINKTNSYSTTPLHCACAGNFLEITKVLINFKADVNVRNTTNFTPLHIACSIGSLDIVKLLIEKEANKDAKTVHGLTPLHVAVINNNIKICSFLLQSKADAHAETNDGITALDIAYEGNYKDIIHLFQQYGISTISEQQAEENMHAFLAELNKEEEQKKQALEKKRKKNLAKKSAKRKKKELAAAKSSPEVTTSNDTEENTLLPQKESAKRKQRELAAAKSLSETTVSSDTKEPLSNEPQEILVTTPIITSFPAIASSPIKSVQTTKEPVTIFPSIKRPSIIKEEKSSALSTKTESSINQNNDYQILQDAKIKWPQSLTTKQLDSIKEHLKQLTKWPNLDGLDVKKLKNGAGMFRLRVGKHRITFSVDEAHRIIKIHTIGLRKNVYKNLNLQHTDKKTQKK